MPWHSDTWFARVNSGLSPLEPFAVPVDPWNNTHWTWVPDTAAAPAPATAPTPQVPAPTPIAYDPQLDANALYGKPMVLSALGYARIGAAPAPLLGPYINGATVDFLSSFGVPADVNGEQVIFNIYLDQELAWTCPAGGTQPSDGTFLAEPFDWTFKPGRLDQAPVSLESEKFPGDENAYRPQMLLEIRNLVFQRYMDKTGKPTPYVSADIGTTTGGAIPSDGINIGEGYVRIATSPWGGYTIANCEYVGVTDVAPGYLIGADVGIINLGQAVTYIPNIRLLQSDKLRMSDYGSNVTPAIVFTRDMIVGGSKPIVINRSDPSQQPRQDELITVDPDQDYTGVPSLASRNRDPVATSAAVGKKSTTLPIIMNADQRQALVTFRLWFDENARKTVQFKAMPAAIAVEPGDLMAFNGVADGIENEVFEITETTHYPDFTVGIVARSILRCAFYVAPPTSDPYFGDVILLMHFEGGAHTFTDSSAFGNAFTASGDAQNVNTWAAFGSASLALDGSGDGLETAFGAAPAFDTLSPTNTSPYTIECFVRFTAVNRLNFLIAKDIGAFGRSFRLYQNNNTELQLDTSSDGVAWNTVSTSGASLAPSTAYHVAADKDSTGTVRIYINGVMKAKAAPADSAILGGTGAPVSIGMAGLGGGSLAGNLDELRVTRGVSRYGDVHGDASFTPPAYAFPDE